MIAFSSCSFGAGPHRPANPTRGKHRVIGRSSRWRGCNSSWIPNPALRRRGRARAVGPPQRAPAVGLAHSRKTLARPPPEMRSLIAKLDNLQKKKHKKKPTPIFVEDRGRAAAAPARGRVLRKAPRPETPAVPRRGSVAVVEEGVLRWPADVVCFHPRRPEGSARCSAQRQIKFRERVGWGGTTGGAVGRILFRRPSNLADITTPAANPPPARFFFRSRSTRNVRTIHQRISVGCCVPFPTDVPLTDTSDFFDMARGWAPHGEEHCRSNFLCCGLIVLIDHPGRRDRLRRRCRQTRGAGGGHCQRNLAPLRCAPVPDLSNIARRANPHNGYGPA